MTGSAEGTFRGGGSDAAEFIAPASSTPLIVLCDHASNALPPAYGSLGLEASELARHIAYDIGAAGVTRSIADRLGAAAVLSRWSRLLIDLNRGTDDPTLIMRLSDGAVIPGNRTLSRVEREVRIATFYRPYHDAIASLIERHLTSGLMPVVLSVHSFTPIWRGEPRPWHVAVLWDDSEPRLALPLLQHLRADPALVVGDNEPYAGGLPGDTLWTHGLQRGLPHVIVELRQDLIESEAGQRQWGERLALIMAEIVRDYGSATVKSAAALRTT